MDDGRLQSWLTLFLLPGMSGRLFHKLVEVFDSPDGVLRTEPALLADAGLSRELVDALRAWRDKGAESPLGREVRRTLDWQTSPGHRLLPRCDTDYPPLLAAIPDPPPVLFVNGEASVLHRPQLAVVGSRTPTAGGCRLARGFAAGLGAAGYVITSGLALGIDRESHLGALDAPTPTVAVLGSGIDQVSPRRNRGLAERILAEGGALVSEFPLGAPPNPWHFPQRNRIISGLAAGVLVVEAALPSGSLVTARCALEQGREVFAVPGSIHNPRVRGCHHLIREGAALVESVEDILAELGGQTPAEAPREPGAEARGGADERDDPRCAGVLRHIGYDRVTFDQLLLLCGLEVGELGAVLMQLEIAGRIETAQGGYVLRESGGAPGRASRRGRAARPGPGGPPLMEIKGAGQ